MTKKCLDRNTRPDKEKVLLNLLKHKEDNGTNTQIKKTMEELMFTSTENQKSRSKHLMTKVPIVSGELEILIWHALLIELIL